MLTVAVVPLIRLVMYWFGSSPTIALSREFQAVADALSTGCLLSLLHNRLSATRYRSFISSPLALIAGVTGVCIGYASVVLAPAFAYVFGQTVANLGTAIVVDYAIRRPKTPFGHLLNTKPMAAIGVLSYSLYLWQEPFLFYKSTAWVASFPQNVFFAFAAAIASYYCIERPFLRKKSTYTKACLSRPQADTRESLVMGTATER
jgi:peptidoglycan/LPS O-acetylase OafA/YrhL